jgi:hypothetical protein
MIAQVMVIVEPVLVNVHVIHVIQVNFVKTTIYVVINIVMVMVFVTLIQVIVSVKNVDQVKVVNS